MNKILTMIAAASVMALAACDSYDDRFTPEYASVVRLNTFGNEDITVWSTAAETDIDIRILRSGHDIAQTANATLRKMTADEWTTYALNNGLKNKNVMPDDCLGFNGTASTSITVPFTTGQIASDLTVNLSTAQVKACFDRLGGDNATANMVMPLVLDTDNGSVYKDCKYLVFAVEYQSPQLTLSPVGFDKMFCNNTGAPYEKTFTVSVNANENPWNFTVRLSNSKAALDAYNAANGTVYSLIQPGALEVSTDGTTWSDWADQTLTFAAGELSKSVSVRLNPAKSGLMDAMALQISEPSIDIEIPEAASGFVFALAVKPPLMRVSGSSATASNDDGSHPVKNLFDGRVNTIYRSADTAHDGDPVYGSYVDIKLPAAASSFAFDLTSASISYDAAGNPNEVHVYGSVDGTTWEKFGEITDMQKEFGGSARTATFGNYGTSKPVSYIRWAVVKAGSTGEADLREANTTAFWAATHLRIYAK